MFVKCDDLHLTNMEPLKCNKVYNTTFIVFFKCLQIGGNCAKSPTNNNNNNNNNTFANGFILS